MNNEELDEALEKLKNLEEIENYVLQMSNLGKNIEKSLLLERGYFHSHFDKGEPSNFNTRITEYSDVMLSEIPTQKQRVEIAENALSAFEAYEKIITDNIFEQRNIYISSLSNLKEILKGISSITTISPFTKLPEWLDLTEKITTFREKAFEGFLVDLEKDKLTFNIIIEHKGDKEKEFSSIELITLGNKAIKLIKESTEGEESISNKRNELARLLFGEVALNDLGAISG
jgi:hypothetical protein